MSAHQAPFSVRDIESAVEQGREAERERIFGLLSGKERAFVDSYNEKIRREERERIIQVIRDWYEADADLIDGPGNLIDWIQNGETE